MRRVLKQLHHLSSPLIPTNRMAAERVLDLEVVDRDEGTVALRVDLFQLPQTLGRLYSRAKKGECRNYCVSNVTRLSVPDGSDTCRSSERDCGRLSAADLSAITDRRFSFAHLNTPAREGGPAGRANPRLAHAAHPTHLLWQAVTGHGPSTEGPHRLPTTSSTKSDPDQPPRPRPTPSLSDVTSHPANTSKITE